MQGKKKKTMTMKLVGRPQAADPYHQIYWIPALKKKGKEAREISGTDGFNGGGRDVPRDDAGVQHREP